MAAVTSGTFLRSTTMTRRPFASVRSTGFGIGGERGTAGGGDGLEARDVCIDAVRIAEQDNRIAERLRFAFVRLALAQLVRDQLILRLLKFGGGHGRIL